MKNHDFSIKKGPFKDISNPAKVKKIKAGNVVVFKSIAKASIPPPVRKINADSYVYLPTGEVFTYEKHENKSEVSKKSIKRSLDEIRNLLNANCTDESKLLWVTLTYKENMTDCKRLSKDFSDFWGRFTYYLKKNSIPKPEYISVVEPQGRGAWHCHVMMIFPVKAPYIDNSVIAEKWRHGFTKTKAVHGVDNIGAYFSAYLADMPLETAQDFYKNIPENVIHEAIVSDDSGGSVSKKFVKGARLAFYPSGMNIYRSSGGIVRPTVEDLSDLSSEELKKEKASSGKLTFSSTVEIFDSDSVATHCVNTISNEYYNIKRV